MKMCNNGRLVVISGPSGAGKSTVIAKVMAQNEKVVFSCSATTRNPRPGEVDGREYHFVTKEKFEEMIANNELLEYAQYAENYYGTPREDVSQNVLKGLDVVFDIEVQGAMQIKKQCPDALLIFLSPSNFKDVEKRLTGRGTDSPEVIAKRIKIAKNEYTMAHNYDYLVVNDDPDVAAKELLSILLAENCKMTARQNIILEVCLL